MYICIYIYIILCLSLLFSLCIHMYIYTSADLFQSSIVIAYICNPPIPSNPADSNQPLLQ